MRNLSLKQAGRTARALIAAVAVALLSSALAAAEVTRTSLALRTHETLTVVVPAGATGTVRQLAHSAGGADVSSTAVTAGTHYFGPYSRDTRWLVITDTGAPLVASQSIVEWQDRASGVGTKNGATVLATEYGDGVLHKTVLTLSATPITLTDEGGVGQYGGVKIYDLPAGDIAVLGAVIDADITLTETEWVDTAEGDVGLGTTAVTDGNALATTEQNIVQTTAIAALAAQAGPINAQTGSAGVLHTAVAGGTDSDVYLNVRIDDNAAHITGAGTITGTVTLTWLNLGDF